MLHYPLAHWLMYESDDDIIRFALNPSESCAGSLALRLKYDDTPIKYIIVCVQRWVCSYACMQEVLIMRLCKLHPYKPTKLSTEQLVLLVIPCLNHMGETFSTVSFKAVA